MNLKTKVICFTKQRGKQVKLRVIICTALPPKSLSFAILSSILTQMFFLTAYVLFMG